MMGVYDENVDAEPQPKTPRIQMRDYFASLVLVALVSESGGDLHDDIASRRAYELADAMLKAREGK